MNPKKTVYNFNSSRSSHSNGSFTSKQCMELLGWKTRFGTMNLFSFRYDMKEHTNL